MVGVAAGPLIGKFIDGLVPWYASLIGILAVALTQAIQVGAGGIHVAAVVVVTVGIDVFRQMLQTSLATKIFGIQPDARARLNAVFILSVSCWLSFDRELRIEFFCQLFLGQVTGTAAGTKIFNAYGWRANAGFALGLAGWMMLVLLSRGPHETRYTWVGYSKGIHPVRQPNEASIQAKDDLEKGLKIEREKSIDADASVKVESGEEKDERDANIERNDTESERTR